MKALALDPDLAEAHSAVGTMAFMFDWDWERGEQKLEQAISLDPSLTWTRYVYADMLSVSGRFDEAIEQIEEAQRLDPISISPMAIDLGLLYARKGELEKAALAWQAALELFPSSYQTHRQLGNYFCGTGRFAEGIEKLEFAASLIEGEDRVISDLGYCYALAGEEAKARELLTRLEKSEKHQYVDPVHFATLYLGLGEKERAIELLQRAYEIRAFMLVEVGTDRRYDPIRSDPRFEEILRGIGLPQLILKSAG